MHLGKGIEQDSFSGSLYFPTMIFTIECHDHLSMNEHVLSEIYKERGRDRTGIERSNIPQLGGWHSKSDLHLRKEFQCIVDHVNKASERIVDLLKYDSARSLQIGTMWAIVNSPGSANKSHIHPGAHWSGVYYVQTPSGSGEIEFVDPRTAQVMNQPVHSPNAKKPNETWTKVRYTPKAGKMLIFPSWLYHSVAPNLAIEKDARGNRVIVSFNITQTS